MKPLLNLEMLLPVGILLLQIIVILFVCLTILKKVKIIKSPLAGLEYSQAIFACCILFAVFIIDTASVSATFQSFKTYQNQQISILQPLFSKSGQYFLVVLFFEALLGVLIYLVSKILFGLGKGIKEIESGNIPFSLLISAIIIGFSIVLNVMAKEVIEYIVPHYLNFR
jgi:hypothetical protein